VDLHGACETTRTQVEKGGSVMNKLVANVRVAIENQSFVKSKL